ncbi:methyltransferase [Planococcaceae bacterium Storch 2/2-2]|nr:methyltransferase [Planococcaceae bacterium Storch 2/2-2]
MDFSQLQQSIETLVASDQFLQATISQPRMKSQPTKRIRLKPVELRGTRVIQFEYQEERILSHDNIERTDLRTPLDDALENFRQIHLETTEVIVHVQISKKYKVFYQTKPQQGAKQIDLSHNRQKNYILKEGTVYPFLVELDVQTSDGRIKAAKRAKFRQINRFLEMIDDTIPHLPTERTIRIIDFGSGKSYLTFALYHYLKIEKNLNIEVTGLDLKKEVIEHCQQLSDALAYDSLSFEVGDINDYESDSVDMVVTLHACDIATDMALARAVKWGARVIMSVPCCQHELFNQIDAPALELITQHGLMKERFSALATDTMRAELLELVGYDTQLVEFIDLEHTPKNILIRAYRHDRTVDPKRRESYEAFRNLLNAKPYLEEELRRFGQYD